MRLKNPSVYTYVVISILLLNYIIHFTFFYNALTAYYSYDNLINIILNRLPIVQTSGFVFLSCTLPILDLQEWKCNSNIDLFTMGPEARTQVWHLRVRNIQGAMIIVGTIQMFLGYSGKSIH